MKKLFQIFILIFIIKLGKAQPNLVANPSFEIYFNLNPNSTILQDCISNWYWGLGYFHSLRTDPSFGVPNNEAGHQYAHTGSGYCGIYTFAKSTSPPLALRNYIQTKLNQNLLIGKRYRVAFYVSLGDTMHVTNNNIGAYFAPDSLFTTANGIITNIPQIENETTNDLSSKADWTLVCDTFLATGNERWMTIGNFYTDSLSAITALDSNCSLPFSINCGAYYYIDDVSVTLIDETGIEKQLHNKFILYPNPNIGCFRLQYKATLNATTILSIRDIHGKQLDQIEIINSTTEYKNPILNNGLYFYTISQDTEELARGKFVVIH
jgi:hypothetical protein